MVDTAPKITISEEQKNQKPGVLISAITNSLAQNLTETLLSQNCLVIGLSIGSQREGEIPKMLLTNPNFIYLTKEDIASNTNLLSKIQYAFLPINDKEDVNEIENLLRQNLTVKKLYIKETETEEENTCSHLLEQIIKEKKNTQGVCLSDVYGPGMNQDSPIAQEIITGKEGFYPLYISDALHGLLKIMFSQTQAGEIYHLSGKKNSDWIKLAWSPKVSREEGLAKTKLRQGLKPEIKPNKTEEEATSEIINPLVEDLFSKSTDDLFKGNSNTSKEQAIPNLLQEKLEKSPKKPLIIQGETSSRGKIFSTIITKLPILLRAGFRFSKSFTPLFALIVLFGVVVLYPIFNIYFGISHGQNLLEKSQHSFSQAEISQGKILAQQAENAFEKARSSIKNLDNITLKLGLNKRIELISRKTELGTYFARWKVTEANLAEKIAKIIRNIQEGNDIQEVTREADLELFVARQNLACLEATLQDLNGKISKKPSFIGEPEEIYKLRSKILIGQDFLGLLPKIAGKSGKKSYLVLFQNNTELRPTGGRIDAYGVFTFEDGRLFDVSIEDIYNADSQLKGHVVPPISLAKYLESPNWYLRDSNWSPDFPTSAQKAEWFFVKETGRQVDGTIAIDLTAIQYLLAEIGPLEIPEYKETIDSKNLFEKAMAHAEINISQEAAPQKNIMGLIGGRMWEKVLTLPINKWPGVLDRLIQSFEEKHLQIFFHDLEVQEYFEQKKWSGAVEEPICSTVNCLPDYFLFIDSNVGTNKGNFYLKRRFQKETMIDKDGQAISEILVTLENTSPTNNWPAGPYKTYLRFIVPYESKLYQVKIDGKIASFSAQTETEKPTLKPGELEIDIATEEASFRSGPGKTSFGLFLEVPIKTKKEIDLLYKLPQRINLTEPTSRYQLLFQKQAGTGYDPAVVAVSYPQFLRPQKITPETALKGNLIKYTYDLSVNREILIDFIK